MLHVKFHEACAANCGSDRGASLRKARSFQEFDPDDDKRYRPQRWVNLTAAVKVCQVSCSDDMT